MKDSGLALIKKNNIPMLAVDLFAQTGKAEAFFATRQGGCSEGICGTMSLNIFKKMNDPYARQNFDIFCSAIGVEPRVLVANHETHTDIVTVVDKESIKQDVFDTTEYVDADGMVTNSKDICLFLYASDCAMLFFLDPKKEALGACHAGWVGSINGIIGKTVCLMTQEYGSDPQDILVAISPTIGPCCYCVDASRYEKILAYDPRLDEFVEKKDGVYFLDLTAINQFVVMQTGIPKQNITASRLCTSCCADLFHSYRRDEGKNGVNGAFLRLLP
ncbi:MAG: peptidoglycan editing factor PgeF [Oscillospiraceae bacterium]|nr:peptidoglycan editing factor PgeF [Oscillospiraceae bacterium]